MPYTLAKEDAHACHACLTEQTWATRGDKGNRKGADKAKADKGGANMRLWPTNRSQGNNRGKGGANGRMVLAGDTLEPVADTPMDFE